MGMTREWGWKRDWNNVNLSLSLAMREWGGTGTEITTLIYCAPWMCAMLVSQSEWFHASHVWTNHLSSNVQEWTNLRTQTWCLRAPLGNLGLGVTATYVESVTLQAIWVWVGQFGFGWHGNLCRNRDPPGNLGLGGSPEARTETLCTCWLRDEC